MASSLAIERPSVLRHVTASGKLVTTLKPPSPANELRIWLFALILPAAIVAIGGLASFWRSGGIYLASAAGIVGALVVPLRTAAWAARHSHRFPSGIDLVPDSASTNISSQGEWEKAARETVISLSHWAIALALAAALLAALLGFRRRRAHRRSELPSAAVSGGAPEVSPLLAAEGASGSPDSRSAPD